MSLIVERKFEGSLGRLLNHCEGQSQWRTWSVRVLSVALILPVALAILADLAQAISKFFTANGEERAMKAEIKNLVDGFKMLNRDGCFGPRAEKQIGEAKVALARLVAEHIGNRAKSVKDFLEVRRALEMKLVDLFEEIAGDALYIENKGKRGATVFIRDVALEESFDTWVEATSLRFIDAARKEKDLAGSLALGVDQKFISPDQAEQNLII